MLSYAFQELKKKHYEDIEKEEFERIQDLFAEILYKGMSMQLKQGLYREYTGKVETLPLLKGRLDIKGTIRNKLQRRNVLSCEYDELSENNLFNRILKTTAAILLCEKCVSRSRKVSLRQLMPFFAGVDVVNPFTIKWNMLRFQRSNQTYKMLMNICYFIIDGMLMTTETGNYKMATFSDEHMNKLFERFVLEYYKVHHKGLSANADIIEWNINKDEPCVIDYLPTMRSDILLHKGNRILIIDTKYYGHAMQQYYDKYTIHSGNLYQIYTYVKNRDINNSGDVLGLLLYAKTEEDITPNLQATFGNNKIMVNTLDLNQKFKSIAKQLDGIIQEVGFI